MSRQERLEIFERLRRGDGLANIEHVIRIRIHVNGDGPSLPRERCATLPAQFCATSGVLVSSAPIRMSVGVAISRTGTERRPQLYVHGRLDRDTNVLVNQLAQ